MLSAMRSLLSRIWRVLREELRAPDSFASDWYGWITNQGSHGALIGWPLGVLLMLFMDPIDAVLVGTFAYYFLIERLWQGRGQLRDSIADSYHVGAGIAMLAVPMLAVPPDRYLGTLALLGFCWLLWVAVLIMGVAKRL